MKQMVVLLALLLAPQQTSFWSQNYPTGLVGWWKLGEGTGSTAYDSSGNGNNGTWAGTAAGTSGYYSAGYLGPYAGSFDGSTNYVLLPSSTSLTSGFPQGITMSAWVYPTTTSGYQAVLTAQSSTNLRQYGFDLYGTSNLYLVMGANSSPGSISLSSAWAVNAWNMITVTADGVHCKAYVNGNLAYSASYTSVPVSGGSWTIAIGENGSGYNLNFKGKINDVRIYNRALSAGEIAGMYKVHN
jgi:hypothetical protein